MATVAIDSRAQHSRPGRPGEIPVLDLGPWRGGEPGAGERLAAELRHAAETVGFWFVTGHGVDPALVARAFEACRRFHAQPQAAKDALAIDRHNIGYMGLGRSTTRSSRVSRNTRPNLNEAYFVKRELAPDDPDVASGRRFRGLNRWPADLPGFRETVLDYCAAAERLALSMLPLYAMALELEPGFFDAAFADPQFTLRMSHYPPQRNIRDNEFGSAPHTDSSFMTLLPQSGLPGLAVRRPDGDWIDVPVMEGAYLVNTGDMLHRWTNGRFLSTPHRVINDNPADRYAIPFFFDASIDFVMECLPTCTSPGNPPKHPPTTYAEYMEWFAGRNYDHVRDGHADR